MGENNNNIYYIYISPLIILYFYIIIKLNKKKRDPASIIENEKEKDNIKGEEDGSRSTALSQFYQFLQSPQSLHF